MRSLKPCFGSNSFHWKFFGLCLFALGYLFISACENESDPGDPVGPSISNPADKSIAVIPEVSTLVKGEEVTFTATGAQDPVTWALSDISLGELIPASGVFTAGHVTGTGTITATDVKGATGTATFTIVDEILIVTPENAIVRQLGTQTFTSTGLTPFFWTVDNTSLGTMGTTSGTFTADNITGTATVSVVDAEGNTGMATVQVIASQIFISPTNLTVEDLPTTPITFAATGQVGTPLFSLTGQDNGYTGATINSATGVVSITAMPTFEEGNQSLTVTAEDGVADSATATLFLIADPEIIIEEPPTENPEEP